MTILQESFNTADSDTLGPDQTWVEDQGDIDVVSNHARTVGVDVVARVNSSLTTANHYAQALVSSSHATQGSPAVIARKAAAATLTFYECNLDYQTGAGGDGIRLFRRVAGTYTSLASDIVIGDLVADTQYLLRLEIIGDQLSTFFDGALKHANITDTNIAGNLQCGIRGDIESGSYLDWDDFEAGDLQAIEFIASAVPVGNPQTSFTVTIPTVQVGDILILDATHRGNADLSVSDDSGVGSWTLKENTANTSNLSGQLWWKRVSNAGSESGATLTVSGATNSSSGTLTVYRGCVGSGDPIEAILSEANVSGNETQTEITTLTNRAWVCLAVHQTPDVATSTQTCTSPGALTERAEKLSTGGTDCSTSHASNQKVSAGATGKFSWTQTDTISVSRAYALKPSSATEFQEPVGDTLSLAEQLAKQAGLPRAETAALTESLLKEIARLAEESLGLTEAQARQAQKLFAESVDLQEQLGTLILKTQAGQDTVDLIEDLARQVATRYSEQVAFTENFVKHIASAIADTVALTEADQRQVQKTILETVGLSESFSTTLVKLQDVSDNISLIESLKRQTGKGVAEAASLTESFIRETKKSLTDTAAFQEFLSKQLGRAAAEQVGLAENLVAISVKFQSLQDAVAFTEQLRLTTIKAIADTVGLAEGLAPAVEKALAEALGLDEQIIKAAARAVAEVVGLSEELAAEIVSAEAVAVIMTEAGDFFAIAERGFDDYDFTEGNDEYEMVESEG